MGAMSWDQRIRTRVKHLLSSTATKEEEDDGGDEEATRDRRKNADDVRGPVQYRLEAARRCRQKRCETC